MPRVCYSNRLINAFVADDDRTLLARFVTERNQAAFAALVGRHSRMVYGVCRRAVRDEHLAEDAFQAVFLVLAKNPGGAAEAASVGGWLFGVARRVGLAARRHELRHQRRLASPGREPGESDHPRDFDDLLRVLDEELAGLPEHYRAPLVACFLEERTQDEAARELGWSLSTLRRRLERGKELLRVRLTRRGATLAGGLFAGALAPSTVVAAPAVMADPSTVAKSLAAAAVTGAVGVKLGLTAFVLLTLGGIGWAVTGGTEPEHPPQLPPARSETAPAPRGIERPAWATVTGRVVFTEKRELPKVRVVSEGGVKDAEFFGSPVYGDVLIDAKTRGIANAVVWLRPDSDDKKAGFPADKIHPTLAAPKPVDHLVQTGPGGFTPRVLAARAGDKVTFGNPTPVVFNVCYRTASPGVRVAGQAGEFNVIVPAGKAHAAGTLPAMSAPDSYVDNIHFWLKGYVWAFDHPYFAVTDSLGNFTLPNAPVGTWRLVVWHEKVGYLNGAKGRNGERIVIAGEKLELPPRVYGGNGWDDE